MKSISSLSLPSLIGVVVLPAVSIEIDVPAVLGVGVLDLLMFSVELLFVLVLVSTLAGPTRGGEAATELASASALAAACALQGDEAFMMVGITKARQSIYGVI